MTPPTLPMGYGNFPYPGQVGVIAGVGWLRVGCGVVCRSKKTGSTWLWCSTACSSGSSPPPASSALSASSSRRRPSTTTRSPWRRPNSTSDSPTSRPIYTARHDASRSTVERSHVGRCELAIVPSLGTGLGTHNVAYM